MIKCTEWDKTLFWYNKHNLSIKGFAFQISHFWFQLINYKSLFVVPTTGRTWNYWQCLCVLITCHMCSRRYLSLWFIFTPRWTRAMLPTLYLGNLITAPHQSLWGTFINTSHAQQDIIRLWTCALGQLKTCTNPYCFPRLAQLTTTACTLSRCTALLCRKEKLLIKRVKIWTEDSSLTLLGCLDSAERVRQESQTDM